MIKRVNTTDPRKIRRLWKECGGTVSSVRRTGEERWMHPAFETSVRSNGRRNDIPAVILCRLNHIIHHVGGTREMTAGI